VRPAANPRAGGGEPGPPARQSGVNNIFAKVGGDKCALNETTSDSVPAHRCCLPTGVDITGFVCEPDRIEDDGFCSSTSDADLKIDGFYDRDSGFENDVANEVACICCGGAIFLKSGFGRTNFAFKAFCEVASAYNTPTCPSM